MSAPDRIENPAPGTAGDPLLLKLVAFCLSYPDDAWWEALPDARTAAAGLSDAGAAEAIGAYLGRFDPDRRTEHEAAYVERFDFGEKTTLHLASRAAKDASEHRLALLAYSLLFEEARLQPQGESVDSAPTLLELAAAAAPELSRRILAHASADFGLLHDAFLKGSLADEAALIALIYPDGFEKKEALS